MEHALLTLPETCVLPNYFFNIFSVILFDENILFTHSEAGTVKRDIHESMSKVLNNLEKKDNRNNNKWIIGKTNLMTPQRNPVKETKRDYILNTSNDKLYNRFILYSLYQM